MPAYKDPLTWTIPTPTFHQPTPLITSTIQIDNRTTSTTQPWSSTSSSSLSSSPSSQAAHLSIHVLAVQQAHPFHRTAAKPTHSHAANITHTQSLATNPTQTSAPSTFSTNPTSTSRHGPTINLPNNASSNATATMTRTSVSAHFLAKTSPCRRATTEVRAVS